MKKNLLKRIGAVALAVAVSLTMGTSAFAAAGDLGEDSSHNTNKSGVVSKAGVVEGTYDSSTGKYAALTEGVSIDKEIVVYNTNAATLVYDPNITYTYTVSAVTVSGTPQIKDEFDKSGTVYSGEIDANTNTSHQATVAFSSDNSVTTSSNYAVISDSFTLTFDATKFSHAGIYRYKITESVGTDARKAAGITNSSYSADRYLDVYVQNGASALEIYGYVLFESANPATQEFTANPGTNLTAKTNGFVSNKNDDSDQSYSKDETDVDLYLTTNVKVTKVVDGTLGDKTHQFPFEVVLANSDISTAAKVHYAVSTGAATNATSTSNATKTFDTSNHNAKIGSASATAADGLKLANGQFIDIYGIPISATTTVNATEYNDTADTYTVTAKYNNSAVNLDNTNATAETNKASLTVESKKTAFLHTAQTLTGTQDDAVEVTNNLTSVSPTNVVMRFAPYLFILGAAIVLLVLMRRRKAQDAE